MIERLICLLRGHAWRYLPAWITGEPEAMRECVRCFVVHQRIRHFRQDGSLRREWWVPIGRRPVIARRGRRQR